MDREKMTSEDPIGLSKEDLEALFEGAFNQQSEVEPIKHKKAHQNTPFSEALFKEKIADPQKPFSSSQDDKIKPTKAESRPKSSLRIKYEAEVSSMIKTHGDLESIRRKLGLSKRKISQLLLVDPSAWTRWTQKGGEAPPHIYRALEWFILLEEKHPQYKASLWLNAVATPQLSPKEIESLKKQLLEWMKDQAPQPSRIYPIRKHQVALYLLLGGLLAFLMTSVLL